MKVIVQTKLKSSQQTHLHLSAEKQKAVSVNKTILLSFKL